MMMEKEEQSLLVFYDTELSKKTITQVRCFRSLDDKAGDVHNEDDEVEDQVDDVDDEDDNVDG